VEKRKTSKKYSPEIRERAVCMVVEHAQEHASEGEAIGSIAAKIGRTGETLRGWVRPAGGAGPWTAAWADRRCDRMKALERENRELRQANESLRKTSAYLAAA